MIEKLIEDYKLLIDKKLDELLPYNVCKYGEVIKAARYSLLSGGKRIRPLILLEFYKLCGGVGNYALNFAAALEMIHTYSLIHDDLPCMDNDDMRRGKPSCHKAFGESTALLAGDALLTEAFNVAAGTENIPAERIVEAIAVLSKTAGINGMVAGQVIDLTIENNSSLADIESITDMYLKKTACLLEAAAVIGCILAGAEEKVREIAAEYAHNLGLAFQIIDDILDCCADETVLGKPTGSDAKNGKTTFVKLYGVEGSRQKAYELTANAVSCLEKSSGDKTVLKELTEYLLDRKY